MLKRTLFFGQYLEKGQCFSGFITFDDSVDGKVIDRVKDAFGERILFGSRRFAGYGFAYLLAVFVIAYRGLRDPKSALVLIDGAFVVCSL